MKAIIAIAFLFAVVSAQRFCVDYTQDDTTCTGLRSNWPTKVCNSLNATASSATFCDSTTYFGIWHNICPVKNVDNSSFCQGTGYLSAYTNYPAPCLALQSCNTDSDCNPTPVPQAPVAQTLYCYDCCLFCFDDATCQNLVASQTGYTNSTTCVTCKPAAPVAAPTTSTPSNPSTTPTKTPIKNSSAAVAVVSGVVLAFSALFL